MSNNGWHGLDSRLSRLETLVVIGDRRARFEQEFEDLCARDAAAEAARFEVMLTRAWEQAREEGSLDGAPEIVRLMARLAAGDYTALDEMEARAKASHERDKERYVQARLGGWKPR